MAACLIRKVPSELLSQLPWSRGLSLAPKAFDLRLQGTGFGPGPSADWKSAFLINSPETATA
jgi:hypothetical protein